MLTRDQMPSRFRHVCDEQEALYKQGRSIQVVNAIPDTPAIPLDNKRHWLRIPDVICLFVDMTGSTKLSATRADKETAGAYQLFTETAVRLFDEFEAPYIEIQGDGVFALFNREQSHRALAAAVTFRTFVKKVFSPALKKDTGLDLEAHAGLDRRTVLVKRLGFRSSGERTDRQNEVWAGKPVNMAAKLSSLAGPGMLLASDRYVETLTDDRALLSCGCIGGVPSEERTSLWSDVDLSNDVRFDFDSAHRLDAIWCEHHGAEYCDGLLASDEN